jgi:hypothetical protein
LFPVVVVLHLGLAFLPVVFSHSTVYKDHSLSLQRPDQIFSILDLWCPDIFYPFSGLRRPDGRSGIGSVKFGVQMADLASKNPPKLANKYIFLPCDLLCTIWGTYACSFDQSYRIYVEYKRVYQIQVKFNLHHPNPDSSSSSLDKLAVP